VLLKRVRLENFKKFDQIEHRFAPGINVVRGPSNEIGKSTFLDGIIAALFDNPKSTSKELDRYIKWGTERHCRTVITFETNTTDYTLEKDFETKTLRLIAEKTGEEWTTPAQVSAKLRMLLGTDSSTLFLSTSCIRQDAVRDIESGKREIGDSLESIVTGGTEETAASHIANVLKKQIDEMMKGTKAMAKDPGPIASLTKHIGVLKGEIEQIKGEVDAVENQKIKLIEASKQLAELEITLGEKETVLEKNERRRKIEDAIKKYDQEYQRIDGLISDIESLERKVRESESKIQAFPGFTDGQKVLEVHRQLNELNIKRNSTSEDILKRREELKLAHEQLRENRLLAGLASNISLIAGLVIAVAGFVASGASALLGKDFNVILLGAGAAGLLLVAATYWARSTISSKGGQIPGLKNRIEQMENAIKTYEKQEQEALASVQCRTIEEFSQRDEEYSQFTKEREALQNQLKGKLGEQTIAGLGEQRREMLKNIGVEQEKITEDMKSTVRSPEDYVKHEAEVKALREKKRLLEDSKREISFRVNSAKVDAEVLAQREEELEMLKNKLTKAQRKVKVYELAREFIERARTETLISTNEKLQVEIQKNFEIFTNGKYSRVDVKEGTLDLSIYSEEKGDLVKPDELSGGAIDEFYLACRLALVHLLYKETVPPLILDDPFVNFDPIRLARTLEFLKGLSQRQQIIIFTLGDSFDQIADKIIELN